MFVWQPFFWHARLQNPYSDYVQKLSAVSSLYRVGANNGDIKYLEQFIWDGCKFDYWFFIVLTGHWVFVPWLPHCCRANRETNTQANKQTIRFNWAESEMPRATMIIHNFQSPSHSIIQCIDLVEDKKKTVFWMAFLARIKMRPVDYITDLQSLWLFAYWNAVLLKRRKKCASIII